MLISIALNKGSSEGVRDAMSKYIYFSLRDSIICKINGVIKCISSTAERYIGILDMPGFGKHI